jgi:hypothetical protein
MKKPYVNSVRSFPMAMAHGAGLPFNARLLFLYRLSSVTSSLTRIIHDTSAASADTRLQRAVSPFTPSTYCTSMPQGFTPPSARLASRLHAFATNRQE